MSWVRRQIGDEGGQTLALFTIFMMSLLGMCAFAIDAGGWYQARRAVQATADASALAGASQLPSGWSTGQTTAQSEFTTNKKSGDAATYANVTVNSSNDSVRVTVSRTSPSFFANLFGIRNAHISATATATVLAYSKIISTGQVMPWGVMKASWTLGSTYPLYVDNSTPNNGALSLNSKSGTICQSSSGANDYKNEIIGGSGGIVCDVTIGDVVPVKTGQNAGPTGQGIDARVTTWDPLSAIVQISANGQATILKPNSPQLVLLPVVTDLSGGSTWPSGSGSVRVVGFAYFVLTSPGYINGGKTVVGTFVGLQINNDSWSTGPWTPGTSTAYKVELTG